MDSGVRENNLKRIWSGEGLGLPTLARFMLRALSIPFLLALTLRKLLYALKLKKRHTLPCPVLSVGNITAGGTGKTPMVEFLVRKISAQNAKAGRTGEDAPVVVLSRGYGGRAGEGNEESLVLGENLEGLIHLQGADRVSLGRDACKRYHPSAILLDDGFQHLKLNRDLDMVLLDSLNPFGYGYLLPRGLLREPLGSLERAHLLVLTRADQVPRDELVLLKRKLGGLAPGIPILEARHQPLELLPLEKGEGGLPLSALADCQVFLFAGIGNFEGFRSTVASLGAAIVGAKEFSDHHAYTPEELAQVKKEASGAGAGRIVTTQKDGVKIRPLIDPHEGCEETEPPLCYLKVKIELTSGEEVLDEILAVKGFLPQASREKRREIVE